MHRVTILTTDEEAAGFASFTHDGTQFAFALLTCEGPRQLVEGTPWAFVDWTMAECSGLELVRRLRSDPRLMAAHVTMVIVDATDEEKRRALAAGADDYATQRLGRQAMLDRVLALHADYAHRPNDRLLELGKLSINMASEHARWGDKPVPLRPNEFRVLRFLAENPDRIFTRQDLIAALGKAGDPDYVRTVDVWIKRLRAGLRAAGAGHLLRTVHGKGYVLDRP